MKKTISLFILALTLLAAHPALAQPVPTLSQRLSGRILLQVQSHGEAWYVYPGNRLRYYLGRPADAFRIMRELGWGISESDYERYKNNPPARLLGWIMLRVQENGEAYYVDPVEKRFIFLGRPADAFRIMREKGLGITNANISRMPVSGASIIPPNGVMNIIVEKPDWNDIATTTLAVSGQARVFENSLAIRLRNSNDKILTSTTTLAQSPDIGQYGPFEKTINVPAPGTSTGYLEVFTFSAQDGSEIDKVITRIVFQ